MKKKDKDSIKEWVYVGGSCLTRYWIWDEEHDCIAHVKLTSSALNPDGTLKASVTEPEKKEITQS